VLDTIRYVLGVILLVMTPPAIFFWYLIHPLAAFWRKMGLWVTYTVVGILCVGLGFLFFRYRGTLMGPDLGTQWILWIPGATLYGLSAWINALSFRNLTVRTFTGVPELSQGLSRGILLQEGAYGVVRHPRYASVLLGIAGYSLFVNYLGVYLVVLATIPGIFFLIILEERELRERFGPAYDRYRRRVPALFPRTERYHGDEEAPAERIH